MSVPMFEMLQKLVDEVGSVPKTAAALSEPTGNGATGSDSQHPSASMDDGLQPVKTGPLLAEKSTEVKDLGEASIDAATAPAETKPQESREASVGLTVAGVGNDPATEDNFQGTVKEPGVGTSSQAKFDDGRKYASAGEFMKQSAEQRAATLTQLANEILAEIAIEQQKTASVAGQAAVAVAPGEAAADELIKEAQAGYELAAALGMEKMSAEERAQATIGQTIRDSLFDAELVGAFFKHSNELPPKPEDEETPGGGGGAPPPPEGGGGPSPEMIEQALGGAMGGGAPGGMPPGAAPGEMPGEAPGGEQGAGGISKDEALQELLMAMQELGITVDDLAAASATQGQGAAPQPGPEGPELAKMAKEFQRSGKFEFKTAQTKRSRSIRNHMKQMLREMGV